MREHKRESARLPPVFVMADPANGNFDAGFTVSTGAAASMPARGPSSAERRTRNVKLRKAHAH